MRVSNRMLYSQLVNSMNSNTEKLLDLNNKASSGKRITRPGDDPVAMANVLIYRSELSSFDQYKTSIDRAKGFLNRTDSVLDSVQSQLDRALELATQQASQSDKGNRLAAAQEIKQIREAITGLANSKYGDKFIFGGTNTQEPPFIAFDVSKIQANVSQVSSAAPASPSSGTRYIDTDDGHIYQYDGATWQDQGTPSAGTAVKNTADNEYYVYSATKGWQSHYQGNDGTFGIKVSKSDEVTANIPGSTIFQNADGNIVQTLVDLEKALRNNDQEGVAAAMPKLQDCGKIVNNNLALVGARSNRLTYISTVTTRSTTDTKASLSDLEDVDYAQVLTDLKNQETIYQASLKSAAMISQMSLANYI